MKIALDKKSSLYLLIFLITALIFLLLIFYFIRFPKFKESSFPEIKKETLFEKQLKELEKLEKGIQPLTEEQTKAQLEELERLSSKTQSLSQEEIQKQLEELDKLRSK